MKIKQLLLGAVFALSSINSSAALIQGQLDFVGAAIIDRENGQYASIDFLFDPITVVSTGDYATSVNVGDQVNVIDPINLSTLTLPEIIWTVDIFSFSLQQITLNNGTTIAGSGVVSAAGFDDTEGFWSFTSQGHSDGIFGFSATAVPEPGSIALFALGLVGLGLSRRRVKQ